MNNRLNVFLIVIFLCACTSAQAAGINSLCTAVQIDNFEAVQICLESYPEMANQLCSGGQAPLHYATSVKMADYLLSKGADVNVKAYDGSTPLFAACQDGNVAVARFLIQKKALIDAQGPMMQTPIMMAAKKGSVELVKLLIANGASIKSRDSIGRTVLEFAQVYGKDEVVELLKSYGADK